MEIPFETKFKLEKVCSFNFRPLCNRFITNFVTMSLTPGHWIRTYPEQVMTIHQSIYVFPIRRLRKYR